MMTKKEKWILLVLTPILFIGLNLSVAYGVISYGASQCEHQFGVKVGSGNVAMMANGEVLLLYDINDSLFKCCSFSLWPFGKTAKWIRFNDKLLRDDK
jgi:hypothetical protein